MPSNPDPEFIKLLSSRIFRIEFDIVKKPEVEMCHFSLCFPEQDKDIAKYLLIYLTYSISNQTPTLTIRITDDAKLCLDLALNKGESFSFTTSNFDKIALDEAINNVVYGSKAYISIHTLHNWENKPVLIKEDFLGEKTYAGIEATLYTVDI